jgi:hypothetical protein
LYRGSSDLEKGYQPTTNRVKDENGDLVTDSHSILARWRNHFSQLLNQHGVNDIRQTQIHTAEILMPEPSAFEIELVIEEPKSHKSPGSDQIPAELIEAGVEHFAMRSINLLFLFGLRRNSLRSGRSRSLYLSITRAIKQTVVIIEAYRFRQLCTQFYPTPCCLVSLHRQRKLLGIINMDVDATGQQLIIYSAFVQ